MINYIFGLFIIVGIIYGMITGNVGLINEALTQSGGDAVSAIVKMIPLLCLWLGVMRIASSSGLINKISRKLSYLIHPLFPELNKDSDSISYISTNIVMNMLGLGSGATPFGLKAMKSMQEENSNKDVASRSMITFLVINTASVTIIPTTVISFRTLNKASNPTDIVIPCIIVTVLSCMMGIMLDRIFYNIWQHFEVEHE